MTLRSLFAFTSSWLLFAGCVSSGETMIEPIREANDDGQPVAAVEANLCVHFCELAKSAGCAPLACEKACADQRLGCDIEHRLAYSCFVSRGLSCSAGGQPVSAGCEEQADTLAKCVGGPTACSQSGDLEACDACCRYLYPLQADEWTELAQGCIDGECAASCTTLQSTACANCVVPCADEVCGVFEGCSPYSRCAAACSQ